MQDIDPKAVNVIGNQNQFDTYLKHTVFNESRKVLDKFISDFRRPDTVSFETLKDIKDPFEFPDMAIDGTKLGNLMLTLENQVLVAGLNTLKDNYKIVLVLFEIFGLTYETISELTGIGKGTAKKYKSRALKILRKYMEENDGK